MSIMTNRPQNFRTISSKTFKLRAIPQELIRHLILEVIKNHHKRKAMYLRA